MTFRYNEGFKAYFERVMPNAPEQQLTWQTSRRKLAGQLPKIWRWFHKRMVSTSRQFGTVEHQRIADEIEAQGWKIIKCQVPSSYEYRAPMEELHYMAAEGLQKDFPQLSDRTKIQESHSHGFPIQVASIQSSEMYLDAMVKASPIMDAIEYNTYTIELQQYVFRFPSGRHYGEFDYHRFALVYDPIGDCLYIEYAG